ncbi:MAG: hypothetical protein RLZZ283_446 [Candidatus Parcubacteria bacterium]|jgi:hypothetical protein
MQKKNTPSIETKELAYVLKGMTPFTQDREVNDRITESLIAKPVWSKTELERNSQVHDECVAMEDGRGRWSTLPKRARERALNRAHKHVDFLFREADRRERARAKEVIGSVEVIGRPRVIGFRFSWKK